MLVFITKITKKIINNYKESIQRAVNGTQKPIARLCIHFAAAKTQH